MFAVRISLIFSSLIAEDRHVFSLVITVIHFYMRKTRKNNYLKQEKEQYFSPNVSYNLFHTNSYYLD